VFCKNCGKKVADGVKFCTNCGTPIVAQPQTRALGGNPKAVAQPKMVNKIDKPKSRNYLLICFGIIFLVVIIIIYATGQTSNPNNTSHPRNPLINTTWVSTDSEINILGSLSMFGGGPGIFEIITIYFGDGDFRWKEEGILFGLPTSSTSSGSYTIFGSEITLNKEGEVLHGKIIGNSMQIGNLDFQRTQ
jgi:hypothetical protein